MPIARAAVANVAWGGFEPFKVPVPSTVVLSMKVTVPLGIPPAEGVTVAVKVTDWPNVEGFREELTAVVVAALFTVCVNAGDVLPAKFVSPP